jgi:hypothetical protein
MYLRAWLDRALKAAGAKTFRLKSRRRFSLRGSLGRGTARRADRGPGPLVITVNGLSQCTSLPQPTDYLTVREELAIMRRDPFSRSRCHDRCGSCAPDTESAAEACAAPRYTRARRGARARRDCHDGAVGGGTAKYLFEKLLATRFPWARVHFFWVDERCVPPADRGEQLRRSRGALHPAPPGSRRITCIVSTANSHPMQRRSGTHGDIREFLGLADGELPSFDLLHPRNGSGCS